MAHSCDDLDRVLEAMAPPVLVVSTVVGRGMYSLGEALCQRLERLGLAHDHVALEDLLPGNSWREDYARYKAISNRFPALLRLVYTVPIFYWRKLQRERFLGGADLSKFEAELRLSGANTVLAVSHRPAFWSSALRRRPGHGFALWGLLGEYGRSLGWKYIFWDQMHGFLTPIPLKDIGFSLPPAMSVEGIELPARAGYDELSRRPGDPDHALLIAGQWGQLRFAGLVDALLRAAPSLTVHVVCGENSRALGALRRRYARNPRVELEGEVESILPLLARCGSVVTKPGIATLVEAHAARRAIFLLPGMPVAEDNNARFAERHLGAQRFSARRFARWHAGQSAGGPKR